jgi:hypothetical protein
MGHVISRRKSWRHKTALGRVLLSKAFTGKVLTWAMHHFSGAMLLHCRSGILYHLCLRAGLRRLIDIAHIGDSFTETNMVDSWPMLHMKWIF